MKKVVFGGILILAGVMLLGIVYIPTSIQCMNLNGWTTPTGKFMYAMQELGSTFPYYLSIILLIVGIIIGLIGCFENTIRKLIKNHNKD
ncbi:hypothetical protein [Vallitalea guaymasensis]|uniref:Uncharacterized protein n=1 Tax=Vallitalea guaymasensis TaxID=1185412 RepID=A0A8J8MCQ9_9FIRM|nr:hypothetical protein [Vallitalea guaymasensis]QUH30285.1 hypothetical protein HYG85_15780 [Vallitalea guaymasensis]